MRPFIELVKAKDMANVPITLNLNGKRATHYISKVCFNFPQSQYCIYFNQKEIELYYNINFISDQYDRFEGITCRSMESIRLGLDNTTSKYYCNEDKNCLAVDTNVGFKSCNYPNVVHPTTKQGAQLYKNQVVSGTNLTRKLVKYAENLCS